MSAEKLRTALARIQQDSFDETAWLDIEEIVTGDSNEEIERELELARMRHERVRDWPTVARFLELEIALDDDPAIASAKQHELGRIYHEELFREEQALEAYKGVLAHRPDDSRVREAIAEIEQSRETVEAAIENALVEALDTEDDAVRGPMLLRAAELTFRFEERNGETLAKTEDYLAQVIKIDGDKGGAPKSLRPRVLNLAAAVYGVQQKWEDLASVLEAKATTAPAKEERIAAAHQYAMLFRSKLQDEKRAVEAHALLLDLDPGNRIALTFLVDHYSKTEDWDHLAAVYEDLLESGAVKAGEELGTTVQLAMLHWRARGRLDQAEPWFERVRRAEPTHAGMLDFYRTLCTERGDTVRLMTILTDAQRATSETAAKNALAAEIAGLAEGQENARRAIDQYKSILRSDPDNDEARGRLKQLYLETESYNALVELLRQELARLPEEDVVARVAALREIAAIYRDKMASDTALLTVLTQILQLDDSDVEAVRNLIRVYESLGRWRDLLTTQQRLAELTENLAEKEGLLRSVARRWLDQFSNVQNAMAAYEALIALAPNDVEAREKLRELYKKRRAWDRLYDLHEAQLASLEGSARVELLDEMAKLAAERLGRGEEAIRLLKEILVFDSGNEGVLDQLERQAERQKDFATVAMVLERRIDLADDEKTRLALLQKLGVLYADKLEDVEKANAAWRRVLESSPGHKRALRVLRQAYVEARDWGGLEDLYVSQEDFEGLADFLSTTADRTAEAADRIALSFRAARVYEDSIGAPERAARSYERVLSVDPKNVEAARALLPLYEQEEKWTRLPSLYEVLLEATEEVDDKIAILRKVAEISGGPLANKQAALGYARKAYEIRSDEEGLEELLAWSRGAGQWDAFIEVVEARIASDAIDDARKRELRKTLAELYATEVEKVDEAVAMYRALLEEDPSDETTAQSFEELLRASDRRDDLRWLFALKVEQASGGGKCDALEDWATVEEEVFGSSSRAIELLEQVIAEDPSRASALSVLTRLLLSAENYERAAKIMALHRDAETGAARVALETSLARLLVDRLDRPAEAYEACVRALDAGEGEPAGAIRLLEQLIDEPRTRAEAAASLEAIYAASRQPAKQAVALRAMLEAAEGAERRLELSQRLAEVHERELRDPGAAFEVILQAIAEAPDVLDLWDRAGELGALAGRPTDLAEAYRKHLTSDEGEPLEVDDEGVPLTVELCERAAVLHEDHLGDIEGAIPYLERILDLEPGNQRAFDRLKTILNAVERWNDLEKLYTRTIEVTENEADKVELLHQAAVVAEDMVGNDEKAIGFYERMVAIDPLHEAATDALDRLYGREERWSDLATLLERRLETATEDDAADHQLRLVDLYLHRLEAHDRVMPHLERLLHAQDDHLDARAFAEECLGIPALRQAAAALLDHVYESVDDPRDLVRVLTIRLEGAESEEHERELLHRIAALQDSRLKNDAGAFETLGKLLPLEPDDGAIRVRLLEIGRRLGEHGKMAEVLLLTAERTTLPNTRGEILMEAAALFRDKLDETDRAEKVYRKVIGIDPDDPTLVIPAAKRLAEIYGELAQHQKLADVLAIQVRLVSEPEETKRLYARIANLYEDLLDDDQRAIEAWQARVAEDAADVEALRSLERLYERGEKWRPLVDTMRQLEHVAFEGEERKRCMVKAADVLATELSEIDEAINAWRAVLDDFGPQPDTLESLAALYRKAERWEDLAEVLDVWISLVDEREDRVRLHAALGDVRREHLLDPAGALTSYRDVLTLDHRHEGSRRALEEMLEHEESEIKREAAEILGPLYDEEGEAEKLLKVLDIEIEATFDPVKRLETLERALHTAEETLESPDRAFEYAARGVKEGLGEPRLRAWIDLAERLGAQTGRYEDLIGLYEEVVGEMLDAEIQQRTRLRAGAIAREHLEDKKRAVKHYRAALEAVADDRKAMIALEELYGEMGDHPELLEILRLRADAADHEEDRIELLFRVAELQAGPLEQKSDAISTYEDIINVDLDRRAIQALEKLYPEANRYDDMVRLYERQLDKASGEAAADLRVSIARVSYAYLKDDHRALDELGEALGADSDHSGAISSLERLLGEAPEPEQRARVAEMLEPVYLSSHDWTKLEGALKARLEGARDPEDKGELLSRLATLYEEQLENYEAALEMYAERLRAEPRDEEIWHEVERLGRVLGDSPGEGSPSSNASGMASRRVAEIFASALEPVSSDDPQTAQLAQRAGELYAEAQAHEEALRWLRRAYSFDRESKELFQAIDRILVVVERREERIEHYRAALDHTFDDETRIEYLHVIARLQQELERSADAIATYSEVLDIDERDARALDALTDLYRGQERIQDLADLYERRADLADSPALAAPYRIELARLLERDELTKERALEQLDIIVRDLPSHAEAVAELESRLEDPARKQRVIDLLRPIYQQEGNWKGLIHLNEERLNLLEFPMDKVEVLNETAALWEDQGGDSEKAFEVVRSAFLLAPDHEDTRSTVERLAEQLEDWEALAVAYERAAELSEDDFVKRQLFDALAGVCDKKLDDPRRALAALGRLSALDPADPEPLERMDLLSMILSDWDALVKVLAQKAENAPGDDDRADVLRRLGDVKRDMLEDPEGAREIYEQALDLMPSSTATLDRLIDLYRPRDAERLAQLLEQRIEHAELDEAEEKRALVLEAATVYDAQLSRPDDAIRMLQIALDDGSGDSEVLVRLERLYRAQRMSEALLDNLKAQAEIAEEAAARTDLLNKIGDLYLAELDNPFDALEHYRLVLEEAEKVAHRDDVPHPADHAIAQARAIGEKYEDQRLEVAALLEPFLRSGGDHQGLVDILELRLQAETDPSDRAQTLGAIAILLEEQLDRPEAARDALLRALSETPESEALHGDIERLSELTGEWDKYAATLAARADAVFDAIVQTDLLTRLGRIAEERLNDDARAIDAYARAAEQADDPSELLGSLDRLYLAAERWPKLAEVLERRIDREVDGGSQATLLYRLAVVQIDHFDQPDLGLGTLRRAADLDPEHAGVRERLEVLTDQERLFEEAAEALDAMYRVSGDNAGRAKLRNKRIGYAPSNTERVRLRLELSQMLEDETNDTKSAQEVIEQAFFDDPSEPELLAQLERLAAINADEAGKDAWRRAADAVGEATAKAIEREDRGEGDGNVTPELARDLYLRSAGWYHEHCDDREAAEKRLLAALDQDPRSGEALASLERLQRDARRTADLIETLRKLANLAEGPEAMVDRSSADLRKEAKSLAEDELGDAELAETIVREMLAADDGDVWALRELSGFCAKKDDNDELLRLLSRRIELMPEPEELRELRHEAARVAEELGHDGQAVDLHEQSFEDDPRDELAATALRRLYEKLERYEDMLRFTERLIDLTDEPQKRADLRLECARLCIEVLNAASEGIDNLNAVLIEVPSHAGAVALLAKMLEKEGRDDDLADLFDKQIILAREEGDQDKELGYRVKLAELHETRLDNPDRAIEGYLAVLDTDSEFRPALQALARLYEQQGDKTKAAATYDKLVAGAAAAERAQLALKARDLYAALGDEEAAIAVLERACEGEEMPGEGLAELRDSLRALYQKHEQWEKLARLVETEGEASASDDEKVVAYRKAAEIHAKKRDDHPAAAALLEKAHAIKSDDRDLMLALCDAYTASSRGKAAIEMLQKVVESYGGRRSKELADIHKRIASAHVAEGDHEAALSELESARKMDPGSTQVLYELGSLSLKLAENGDGNAEHLKRAGNAFRSLLLQRLDAGAPVTKADIFYHLAVVGHLGGNKSEAKKNAERALANDKEHAKAKALLEEIA